MTDPRIDASALRTECTTDPTGIGTATLFTQKQDVRVAELLNAPRVSGPKSGSFLTERGVLSVLGPTDGEAFLLAVEALADANQPFSGLLKRCIRILRDYAGDGLDMGDPGVRAQLTALSQAGLLPAGSTTILVAYGSRQWSRAEILFGEGVAVSPEDVEYARTRV